MDRTILTAGTDHETIAPALALALALARPFGAHVILAGVVERHGAAPPEGDSRLNHLLDRLDDLRDASPGDVPVTVDGTTAPSVVRGIDRLAERHHAQLLVLGPDDRGPLGRGVFGDAMADAVLTAPCGVAIATPKAAPSSPRRIGVAWDDTPAAGEALEWAVQLAERTGGDLEIVHVADARRPSGPDPYAAVETELERVREAAEQRAPAVVTLAWGDPAEVLAHVTDRLDLLVMGSRRRSPLRRALLGSVSRDVLHTTRCPVVVLPRGVHAPADTAAV
jgi:nucleotide-binding universal stress UspA family protein